MIKFLILATHCGLEARVNNDLMQIRADPPESPKSISETSDSSSRQLLSSTDSDDSIQSPKRVVLPRIEVSCCCCCCCCVGRFNISKEKVSIFVYFIQTKEIYLICSAKAIS